MFGLTYLPEKDLERQLELQDELSNCRDFDRIPEIHKEIAELHKKRKPIIKCNLEETTELKMIITRKLEMVTATGKRTQAEQFMRMIKLIDERILVLNMEMAKEAREKIEKKVKEKDQRKEEAKEVTRANKEGGSPAKGRSTGSSRWTSGFGKID